MLVTNGRETTFLTNVYTSVPEPQFTRNIDPELQIALQKIEALEARVKTLEEKVRA